MFLPVALWPIVLLVAAGSSSPAPEARGLRCSDVKKIVGLRPNVEGTAYCSSYLGIKTRTVSVTSTSTSTSTALATATAAPATLTDTVTSVDYDTLTQTLTVPLLTDFTTTSTTTETSSTTVVSTSTSYICPGANQRRDASGRIDQKAKAKPVPGCLQGFKQSLSSACSCLSIPTPSTTVTRTVKASSTVTSYTTITSTTRITATTFTTQQTTSYDSTVTNTITTSTSTAIETTVTTITSTVSTSTTYTVPTFASGFKLQPDPGQDIDNPNAYAVLLTSYGFPRMGTYNNANFDGGQTFTLDNQCRLVAVGGDFANQVMTTLKMGVQNSASSIFFHQPGQRAPTLQSDSFCIVTADSHLSCDFDQGGPTVWAAESSIYESPVPGPWWEVGRNPFDGPQFGQPKVVPV